MPICFSIAVRAAANSRLVIGLAFSKGNSFEFFIAPPFTCTGSPSADNTVNATAFPFRKNDDEHSIIRFTDQPLSDFRLGRVLFVRSYQGKRVIKGGNRLIEANPVFDGIESSLLIIPLESHIYSIYRKCLPSSGNLCFALTGQYGK